VHDITRPASLVPGALDVRVAVTIMATSCSNVSIRVPLTVKTSKI